MVKYKWTQLNSAVGAQNVNELQQIFEIGGNMYYIDETSPWHLFKSINNGVTWVDTGILPVDLDAAALGINRAAATFMHDNKITMVGGQQWDGGISDDNTKAYIGTALDGETWTTLAATPGYQYNFVSDRTAGTAAVSLNGLIYMLGGFGATSNTASKKIFRSADGTSWTQLVDAPWSGRMRHAACVHLGRVYISGGDDNAVSETYNKEVWSSADGINWMQHASLPDIRHRHQMFSFNNDLFIVGGDDWDGTATTGAETVYVSEDAGTTWKSLDDQPPQLFTRGSLTDTGHIIYALSSFVTSSRVLFFGGRRFGVNTGQDDNNEIWELSLADGSDPDNAVAPNEIRWQEIECTPYGRKRDNSSPAQDFGPALVLDFKHGAAFPLDGLNIAATLEEPQGCAGDGMGINKNIGAAVDGHLYELFQENAYGMGCPTNKVLWEIDGVFDAIGDLLTGSDFTDSSAWVIGGRGAAPVARWTIDTGAGTATFAASSSEGTAITQVIPSLKEGQLYKITIIVDSINSSAHLGISLGGYRAQPIDISTSGTHIIFLVAGNTGKVAFWGIDLEFALGQIVLSQFKVEQHTKSYHLKRTGTDDDFPADNRWHQMDAIIRYADGTEVEAIVQTNTDTGFWLTEDPAVAISARDEILVGPMTCGVLFSEQRFLRPAVLNRVLMDVLNAQERDQPLNFGLFTANGNANTVDMRTEASSMKTSTAALERGIGQATLPRKASKALANSLSFQPVGDGYLQIQNIRGEFLVDDAEVGR